MSEDARIAPETMASGEEGGDRPAQGARLRAERAPGVRAARVADAVGLAAIVLFLLDYFRPALLLMPTIMAGGDTPCHYPTLMWLKERLLPEGRLHGWYPGAYLGQPLLLYYFPLVFLLMAAWAPLTGAPVAFKLGTALGVFLVPLCAYAALRLMGFRFPGPLLGAAATVLFLFVEENPIWGGTMASTLTGEFSHTYGLALALLFLGVLYRAYARGAGPRGPAVLLALTALAHGYAVLWAGVSAVFFLWGARRPARTLGFLAGAAVLAFALAGFWLVPLLGGWGWTTPYGDPYVTASVNNLVPPLLRPLVLVAALALAVSAVAGQGRGGADRRLLFLAHAVVAAAVLAAAAPVLGVIDFRFVPCAHLAVALLAGAGAGLALQDRPGRAPFAVGLVALALVAADARATVLRSWIDWDYSGLEAKAGWPDFRAMTALLAGTGADPRVAVEYGTEHEKAGSIRVYETLPLFSGRSTLEGVYNQAGLNTHPVYYVASELGATSPNPFRGLAYAQFDPEAALGHLRLMNAADVVAVSEKLRTSLESRDDVESRGRIGPYAFFRLRDPGPGYVEPLAHEPVRSSPRGWREKAYRWFTRDPIAPAHLVFTDDPRFRVEETDEWLPPPAVPLPGAPRVEARVAAEEIDITTDRPGHPLLVKVSYHPRWRAEGADGPFLVSPALMMVIPTQERVRLRYSRNAADHAGLVLSAAGLVALACRPWRRRRAEASVLSVEVPLDACEAPRPPRRWGGLVAGGILAALAGARLFAGGVPDLGVQADVLHARAVKAFAAGDYGNAAELARHAAALDAERRASALCLRGESLARAGHPGEAVDAFHEAIAAAPEGPYVAQALFGLAAAADAAGEPAAAAAARQRLQDEFSRTPWAERLRAETERP